MTGTTVVLVALSCGWAATVTVALALLRAERRQAARERGLLVNQLLHLAGRTWQTPPDQEQPVVAPPGRQENLIRPSQHLSL